MIKLLLVDHSSFQNKLLLNQPLFSEQFNIVGEAADGRSALYMVSKFEPDVVFLDLHMPDMNGIELLKQIKKNNKRIKVCVFTNYSYPQYRKKVLTSGGDYFLNKNDDLASMNITIEDILQEYR
jgi:YesN/AraC family two-component response regulator